MATIRKTFRLRAQTVATLERLVQTGLAPSETALIERLVGRPNEESLRAEWEEAMRDPVFMADQLEVESAFRGADSETAALIQ